MPVNGRWSLESCVDDPNRLLLCAEDGAGNHALFLSLDGGASWAQATTPGARADSVLRGAISGDNPDALYVWGGKGLMGFSNDFGATIDSRTGNLAETSGEIVGIFGGG